jgi:hypothetical protein
MAHLSRRDRELIGLRVAADLPFRDAARVVLIGQKTTTRALGPLRALSDERHALHPVLRTCALSLIREEPVP